MQTIEQNSKMFISSLSGVEEEISASLAYKNNKTITGAGVTDVINLFSLVSAPPLPYLNKGAEMSCFKENGKWRWNEPSKVIQYFTCRMPEWMDRVGLKVIDVACLLNKSIPSVNSWRNGQAIPPSDIQEMIAQIVGAKSRAEIWIYKGKDITKSRIHLNKLNQEVEKIKNLIQKQLAGQVC